MMNKRLEIVYNDNIRYLKSLIGISLKSVIQEQYYFEGKLDDESMGDLKLELSDKQSFIFSSDEDAESLKIQKGEFSNKKLFESDFQKKQIPMERKRVYIFRKSKSIRSNN